jgi:tRNA(Ile)-lysidine synthase
MTVGITELEPFVARLVGLDGVTTPVVVGCSGGADSLALLALANAAALEPVAVHVDHGSRPGSDADSDVVAAHAARLGVAFRSERVTVPAGANFEARARLDRYRALERAREALRADAVLVGHTADDQAETVLLNLLRGSASAGLGAMAARRDRIVRPLLELRRAETEALCAALGLEPVRDPTNADVALRRNWVRHEVLPLLGTGAGRDLTPVLARQAAIMRDESDYLDSLARAVWPADGERATATLAAMPIVLARRAVRSWLGPPPPSLHEVERVLHVARAAVRATEVAGGRRVWRRGGRLHADDRQEPRRGRA